ncbi:hypothetical protein M3J09_005988 [Ascochyta lentis]
MSRRRDARPQSLVSWKREKRQRRIHPLSRTAAAYPEFVLDDKTMFVCTSTEGFLT